MLIAATPLPMLTIDQVADRLGIDRDGVSRLIASRELQAVNVARSRKAKRPSWRIRPEDLEAFELSRSSIQTPNCVTRKRRSIKKPTGSRRVWF